MVRTISACRIRCSAASGICFVREGRLVVTAVVEMKTPQPEICRCRAAHRTFNMPDGRRLKVFGRSLSVTRVAVRNYSVYELQLRSSQAGSWPASANDGANDEEWPSTRPLRHGDGFAAESRYCHGRVRAGRQFHHHVHGAALPRDHGAGIADAGAARLGGEHFDDELRAGPVRQVRHRAGCAAVVPAHRRSITVAAGFLYAAVS